MVLPALDLPDPAHTAQSARHSKSFRQHVVDELESQVQTELQFLYNNTSPQTISPKLSMLISLHQVFTSTRYLFPNPYNSRPKSAVYRDELLSDAAEYRNDFKDALRVTPAQFIFILQLIEDYPVFTTEGFKP
ncbi:hypothetical protein EC991_004142 [Linnemannia zychae]|nr:hypothetical protein EC991_004142 [Linnemannia zychae]